MTNFSSQDKHKVTDVTMSDVIVLKQDRIHAEMYESALAEYVSYSGISPEEYNFIEIPASYFYEPSRVKVISNSYPYSRKIVDLTPFWNKYMFNEKNISPKLDDDMSVETSEVMYKDYVRGTAELRSKMTGRVFTTPLKDVPDNMPEYDYASIEDTFSYKVQHKIYGI